ncbi:MAG: hypothetical protein AB7N54_20245 [Alphaproteobacteria bacterium]
MPNAEWPGELPDDVLVEGYREAFPDLLVRTEMDAGPAKVRRRFTAAVRPLSVRLDLDREQVDDLDEFFSDDLEHGALPFDWTHPRTGDAVTFRFTRPPEIRPDGDGTVWLAELQLEILP